MTKFQKAFCVLMSLCFFAVLALVPGPFYLLENVYRQLPLYCFLEKEAGKTPWREDPETYEKIIAANAAYLGAQVQAENGLLPGESGDSTRGSVDNQSFVNGDDTSAAHIDRNGDASEDTGVDTEVDRGADTEVDRDGDAGVDTEAAPDGDTDVDTEAAPDGDANVDTEVAPDGDTDVNTVMDQDRDTDVNGVAGDSELTVQESSSEQEESETFQYGEEEVTTAAAPGEMLEPHPIVDLSAETLADYDYLLGQFYILDPNTATSEEQLDAASFLAEDLTIDQEADVPQILIYHSHSQETFADSREGEVEDTIVGVGNYLTKLLTEDYGYNVIHVTETFDIIDGEIDRSRAYDFSREYVEQVLAENPSIEVIIDLHRDGVPEDRRLVTQINGKDTAQIMFYNGLSYTVNNGPVDYLPNPYIQDNLAFSFQLEYQAAMYYPELYRGIYLAGLRYNLHLRPRALLLEAGAQTNTVQEVKNAMEPFADILNRVLQG